MRKHETQSCSESCVFSFSNPILLLLLLLKVELDLLGEIIITSAGVISVVIVMRGALDFLLISERETSH